MRPVNNVNAQYYQDWFFKQDRVLDKIKLRMLWLHGHEVILQHNGAKPHTAAAENTRVFNNYIDADGWVFKWVVQPPQSPDLNKNDLCFFASLQRRAEQLKLNTYTIENLVSYVVNQRKVELAQYLRSIR